MKDGYIINSSNFFLQLKNCPIDIKKLQDCNVFETKEEMYNYLVTRVKYNTNYIKDQELLITLNEEGKPSLCHIDGQEIEVIEDYPVETYISFLHG